MDSTEENNNKALSAEQQVNEQNDHPECGSVALPEDGRDKIVQQMMLEDYAYCVTEDTVTGMHMAQGKPHHAYQMNV